MRLLSVTVRMPRRHVTRLTFGPPSTAGAAVPSAGGGTAAGSGEAGRGIAAVPASTIATKTRGTERRGGVQVAVVGGRDEQLRRLRRGERRGVAPQRDEHPGREGGGL